MRTIVQRLSTEAIQRSQSQLLKTPNKPIKMLNKIVIAFAFFAVVSCGVVPAAYISPYASTFNAHTVNHAVAAPFVHAAPAAKIIASPYSAARIVGSPYAALPYSSLPYSSAYSSAYTAPFASPFASPYAYSPYSYPSNYFL